MGIAVEFVFQVVVAVGLVVLTVFGMTGAQRAWQQAHSLLAADPATAPLAVQAAGARRRAATRATLIAFGVEVTYVAVAAVATGQYLCVAAPDVDASSVGTLIVGYGGVVVGVLWAVTAVLLPFVVAAYVAVAAARRTVDTWDGDPTAGLGAAEAVAGARRRLRSGWARPGLTGIGLVGAALSIGFGSTLLGVVFLGTSSAIACARNPKCL